MPDQTPQEVQQALGVTSITLRRWCDYHKAFLSTSTQPRSGQARRFTGKDLEVLRHVQSLRDQGCTTAIINDQLRTLTFAEVIDPTEDQLTQDDEPRMVDQPIPDQATNTRQLDITAVNVTPSTQPYSTSVEQLIQSTMSTEISRLEAQIVDIKRDSHGFMVGVGLGFVGALLFVIMLLLLFLVRNYL